MFLGCWVVGWGTFFVEYDFIFELCSLWANYVFVPCGYEANCIFMKCGF